MATPTPVLNDRRAASLKQNVASGTASAKKKVRRLKGVGRMRKLDLCSFTQKLAAMLDAGLPLVQCMDALSEQTITPEFKVVVKDIGARIEAGQSFSEALEQYKELFGDLYVSMIRAGEMGGGLSEVTARLATYMENSMAMTRKVKSALTYPVMVLGLAFILTTGMILFVVPVFKKMFEDFGGTLPAPTQMLIDFSDLMKSFWAVFIYAGIGVGIYFIRKWLRTDVGAMTFDRHVLRAPIAGPLIEKVAMARFARTFSSMIRSGVPILKCMEIVSQATGNRFIGQCVLAAGNKIEGGLPLAKALMESGKFPPMLLHMIAAGEKTGNVDGMLEKVADFYEAEVESAMDSLSSMIEPLLMAFLGVTVGGIVICMFMPIFKLSTVVGA